MYPKNAASPEPIAIGAVVQISDGAVQTSDCTVRIKPIGVAEGDGGGTTAYSTDGIVYYTPTQAETNYTSFILIAKKTSCIPVSITVITTSSVTPGTVLLAPVTHTSAVVPTVTTLTGHTAQTGDSFARIGALGAGLTALATQSSVNTIDDFLDTEIAAIKTKTDFLPSATAGSAGGVFIAGSNAATTAATWTVTGATTHTGSVTLNAGLTINQSTLNEHGISITGNGTGQGILVTGGTTGDGVQIAAGTNGIGLIVQGNGSGDGVHIEGGATAEGLHLLGGVTSGSALKIEAQGTNDHALELVSIGTGDGIYVDSMTVTGAVTVGTNAIPWNAAWDAEVQSEAADAITAASLATAANVSAVVTTQMTESYAADGVAPTLAQAIFLIQQAITEFTISGTTTTIKKIDGSTTAATLTLNDGTTPTGVTRAT